MAYKGIKAAVEAEKRAEAAAASVPSKTKNWSRKQAVAYLAAHAKAMGKSPSILTTKPYIDDLRRLIGNVDNA